MTIWKIPKNLPYTNFNYLSLALILHDFNFELHALIEIIACVMQAANIETNIKIKCHNS
jgi:hypothetical protein